jgi:hypothetical protein
MKPDRHAQVLIVDNTGEVTIRPALFVYPTDTGFAWVEPSYRDPYRSRGDGLHAARGALTMQPDGFYCAGLETTYRVWPADLTSDDPSADLSALRWAEADIIASGSTMDAERERLLDAVREAADEL